MSHCIRCFKSTELCLCPYINEFDPEVKFVILMHPKEAYQMRTGTGRLTKLTLKDSEIIVGVDFSNNERLNSLLNDETYYHLMLYPGEDAKTAKMLSAENVNKRLLILVIDATWAEAKKMVRLSTNLHNINKISFRSGYKSEFKFKKQPKEECLSTIESCYYLIKELKDENIISKDINPEPLMNVFNKMVEMQIECENLKHSMIGYEREHERLSLSALRSLKDSSNKS